MKEFKAESKRLLDLMINSIYTNKEIFLRELISNASDANDKLYYKSLTDSNIKLNKEDFKIRITPDKTARTLTIEDTGIGMTAEELESNLGTIAKSGSLAFKEGMDDKEKVDIIGQFGVGFYSAFMVSKKVEVYSKAYGQEKANKWESEGVDGYSVSECDKDIVGTKIVLYLKEDSEDDNYSSFLDDFTIKNLIKKYSDYIKYPIEMEVEKEKKKEDSNSEKPEYEKVKELETLNSMVPLWKKNKNDITKEEYNAFYNDKFYDFTEPLKVIHFSAEGTLNYNALLFIPAKAPFDFYTKEFQKGLQLYSNGVLIMDKCADLLPDHFSFVKGLIDSPDLSLNISRELLQHDRQLKVIAKNIEKKIKSELENMQKTDRETYNKFYENFGTQLKFGIYSTYGMNKDELQDLLMFYSSLDKKYVTLSEYVSRMKDGQDKIYYAAGESVDKIDMLPQVESIKDKGYEVLYLTEDIDEFVIQMLYEYDKKQFVNVSANSVDLETKEEKEELQKVNEESKDMFTVMKDAIGSVESVRFTHKLKNHPVCLTSEGQISIDMEKTLNSQPGINNQKVKAKTILEINESHPIAQKLKELYTNNQDELKNYSKVLYNSARLIEGLEVENPTEFSNLISEIMSK